MSRFNELVGALASGRVILLTFAIAVASFVLMAAVFAPAFQEATGGLRPLDLNFGVDAETVYRQLPDYTDKSKAIYIWFAIADYVYPAAAAAFFSLLWAWMFNRMTGDLIGRLARAGVLAFPFLFALIDWLENAGFLFVVFRYPAEYPVIASLAGTLKGTKPIIEAIILLLTLVFVTLMMIQKFKERR